MDAIKQTDAAAVNDGCGKKRKEGVISCNGAGIKYLLDGDFSQASSSFLSALQDARCMLTQHTTSGSDSDLMGTDDCDMDERTFEAVEIGCPLVASSGENIFSVFNRCLFIPDETSFDTVHARNEDIIPAVILYNIGVSLHMQGMQYGKEALLTRAQDTYEIALTILTGMTEPVGADGILLMLAVINNLAVLESRRFNREKASQYAGLIRGILENEDFLELLEDEAFDFFVLYLFMTPQMCHSVAPVA